MEKISGVVEALRRDATAAEVLALADHSHVEILAGGGGSISSFWEECPSPYTMLLVANAAGAPFWLLASAVDRAIEEAAQLLCPYILPRLRADLLGPARDLRTNPSSTWKGYTRCEVHVLLVALEPAHPARACSALLKASALQGCLCGRDHAAEVEASMVDAAGLVLASAECFLQGVTRKLPASLGSTVDAPKIITRVGGMLVCDWMRPVLDLELLKCGGSWGPGPGGVS